MRELTTVETFTIAGRGTAHVVHVGDDAPKPNENVLLDGVPCRVTGGEWPIRNGLTTILVSPT